MKTRYNEYYEDYNEYDSKLEYKDNYEPTLLDSLIYLYSNQSTLTLCDKIGVTLIFLVTVAITVMIVCEILSA